MSRNPANTGPWYKHFWPWYLVFMKFAVISACIATGVLIYKNPVSMVVDDYYNEGRTINLQLTRVARAEELGLSFYADISSDQVVFEFRTGEPADRSALLVNFYHPTLSSKDFELRVPHSQDGQYRQMMPREISGHWRIDIEPFDREWRVSQNVFLPVPNRLVIEPVNYGI
ncbi:MAG: FixH family protein [Idiomarina sp.]|nr:FixH family protein [Idiomarina sp.]